MDLEVVLSKVPSLLSIVVSCQLDQAIVSCSPHVCMFRLTDVVGFLSNCRPLLQVCYSAENLVSNISLCFVFPF